MTVTEKLFLLCIGDSTNLADPVGLIGSVLVHISTYKYIHTEIFESIGKYENSGGQTVVKYSSCLKKYYKLLDNYIQWWSVFSQD